MPMLSGPRMDAIWRILGVAYFLTFGWITLTIAGIAGLIWMTLDIVIQLLFGREGLPSANMVTQSLRRVWDYGNGQLRYVLFGDGSFPILP